MLALIDLVLERLISNNSTLYCDFNASFPLSQKVKRLLGTEKYNVVNASATHAQGKYSAQRLREVIQFFLEKFSLPENEWQFIFHSGATEGCNLFIQSFKNISPMHFIASPLDHAAVRSTLEYLSQNFPVKVTWAKVLSSGLMDLEFLEATLHEAHQKKEKIFLNTTWVHNELGVVENIADIALLKKTYDFFWHLDATQSIGKIVHALEINPLIDAATYSGHKFGSLKGIGFSFFKKNIRAQLKPLMFGGGQQDQLRPGTIALEAIMSMQWALEDLLTTLDVAKTSMKRVALEKMLQDFFTQNNLTQGFLFPKVSVAKCSNTLFFALKNVATDVAIAAFDLEGIALGSGAACSSGTYFTSHTLDILGEHALKRNALRLSFSPVLTEEEFKILKDKLSTVLQRLCSA